MNTVLLALHSSFTRMYVSLRAYMMRQIFRIGTVRYAEGL